MLAVFQQLSWLPSSESVTTSSEGKALHEYKCVHASVYTKHLEQFLMSKKQ